MISHLTPDTVLGSNVINYYAPTVYQNAMNLERNLSLILGGCTSLTYLIGSIIPLFTADRFGRRSLLMFSAVGLCFCFAMAAILLSLGTVSAAYGATAMVFLFQIFMGAGWVSQAVVRRCTLKTMTDPHEAANALVLPFGDHDDQDSFKRSSIRRVHQLLVFPHAYV